MGVKAPNPVTTTRFNCIEPIFILVSKTSVN
ncbi:MAG: hypothetical protein ACJAZR_000609 [Sediminicola sp.]